MYVTCLLEVKGVDPSPGLEISSYILLTGGAPLLSLWAGTTGCGGDPPTMYKKYTQVRKRFFFIYIFKIVKILSGKILFHLYF